MAENGINPSRTVEKSNLNNNRASLNIGWTVVVVVQEYCLLFSEIYEYLNVSSSQNGQRIRIYELLIALRRQNSIMTGHADEGDEQTNTDRWTTEKNYDVQSEHLNLLVLA